MSLLVEMRVYAVSNGRVVPLTKEVLRLPGRGTLQGGFDIKA